MLSAHLEVTLDKGGIQHLNTLGLPVVVVVDFQGGLVPRLGEEEDELSDGLFQVGARRVQLGQRLRVEFVQLGLDLFGKQVSVKPDHVVVGQDRVQVEKLVQRVLVFALKKKMENKSYYYRSAITVIQ